MRKTSKLLSLLLATVMMFSAFAVNSFAVATELAAGSSKSTATNVPQYGVEYVSTLSATGETDWFKFMTTSYDAYYTINFTNYNIQSGWNNTQQPCIYLYDTYGKELAFYGDTNSINIKLETNTTYYILVKMGSNRPEYTGNYSIKITYKNDPAPNVMNNVKEEISLNYLYEAALDGVGDVDFYKFTSSSAGVYKFSFVNCGISAGWNETQTPNIYILDKFNQEISYQAPRGDLEWEITLEANQTYYIKICMGSNRQEYVGNYKFSVGNESAIILSDISVLSTPNKTTYAIGESFDSTGLVVKAQYSDGTSKTVTNYALSGFDSSTAGSKTITVAYTEGGVTKTTAFSVNVVEEAADEPDSGTGFFLFDFFRMLIDFIMMILSLFA